MEMTDNFSLFKVTDFENSLIDQLKSDDASCQLEAIRYFIKWNIDITFFYRNLNPWKAHARFTPINNRNNL